MKKLLAILLAAMVLCIGLTTVVSAADLLTLEVVFTSDYVYGSGNTTVTAEVRISGNPGATGYQIVLDVPEALTITKITNGEAAPFAMLLVTNPANGTIMYIAGLTGTETIKVDGVIATLEITIDESKLTKLDDVKIGFKSDTVIPGPSGDLTFDTKTTKETSEEKLSCIHPKNMIEAVGAEPAACTKDGSSGSEVCKFCGETVSASDVVPALGHDWDNGTVVEDSTCYKVGKSTYTCKRCGVTEDRDIPTKDHVKSTDYKHDETGHWFYCVNEGCGTMIGEKSAHTPDKDWHNEDVTVDGHYHVCTVCKAPVGTNEHVDDNADGECDVCHAALHEHVADTSKWLYDDEGHYHGCMAVEGCKAKLDKVAHDKAVDVTKEATCTEKGVKTTTCKVCDYKKTEDVEMLPHTADTEWHTENGSAKHWHVCAVCETKLDETEADHTYGEYTHNEKTHTHTCTACGAEETGDHKGGTATCSKKAVCEVCEAEYGDLDETNHADGVDEKEWETDGTNHWHVCKYCDEIVDVEAHKASKDYKHDGTGHWRYCTVCGERVGKVESHKASSEWKIDSTGHWHVCSDCGEKVDFNAHKNAVFTPRTEATSTADGCMAHWYCPDCGKYFYDVDGKIGAGPYDSEDEFVIKHKVGCEALGGHYLVCVPMGIDGHMYVCARNCGFIIPARHNFNASGVCPECSYTLPKSENNVEVVTPAESAKAVTVDEIVVD